MLGYTAPHVGLPRTPVLFYTALHVGLPRTPVLFRLMYSVSSSILDSQSTHVESRVDTSCRSPSADCFDVGLCSEPRAHALHALEGLPLTSTSICCFKNSQMFRSRSRSNSFSISLDEKISSKPLISEKSICRGRRLLDLVKPK